ncbi:MAG: purine-nucleoside phosphorylase [Anaeromicrobium sp.]|jgi:purine-nucleoside phosphorylase|uniref:purine-nucleoside phosphorylase n=1 Tax=Anaeromicrobium sp. TaxID=1929132 RepID=UPI0025D6F064|nr:purine-nucleoside phosphorylase [Anaeromicrobium sp.]MCT4594016.1 purine-nucleoside phosphorylase [Anaeromicrobium sp.]
MSTHIGAKVGDVAERVLLPGDPLRAKFIAETFLEDVVCYNEVRGMYGFTGTYKGKRVSIQGTGMGMPSASIYINELIDSYGANRLIRIGTCGSIQKHVKVRDVVIAMCASTNSNMNKKIFGNLDYAPSADFELLNEAYNQISTIDSNVHVGGILTNDSFYDGDKNDIEKLAEYGVLALEMETSALYTIAAKKKVQALTLLTVSDSLVTWEETSAQERQNTFTDMVKIALEII